MSVLGKVRNVVDDVTIAAFASVDVDCAVAAVC